ncbi:MAG: hypothetical protein PHO79_01735 [Desulfoplanes sp.]|nr:hypothetical protein [Desulfoplanes sp.]
MGIQRFKVAQADQLGDIGLITDIPFFPGFLSRHCLAVLPNRAMFSRSASVA